MDRKETVSIIIAVIVLALATSFKETSIFYYALLSFSIIIPVNIIAKKIAGFNFETLVKTKLWTFQQFGLRKDSHFKNPIPLIWLPLVLTLFSKGLILWLGVLEFDIKAKTERVSKRHGLYRFAEVTEWHMAWIAIWGIIANLIFAIAGYLLGFELFAKLSVYFIAWSIIPLGKLDGSKILYASRGLWVVIMAITAIMLGWGFAII